MRWRLMRSATCRAAIDELQRAARARSASPPARSSSGSSAISSTADRNRSRCCASCAALGSRAVVVLGNHDLHLVDPARRLRAPAQGRYTRRRAGRAGREELVDWLRTRPMMHVVKAARWCMPACCRGGRSSRRLRWQAKWKVRCAATGLQGIPEEYVWQQARRLARRLARLGSPARHRERNDAPALLHAAGQDGFPQPRARQPAAATGPGSSCGRTKSRLVFGHWSALGLKLAQKLAGLDSGCVWGGKLTALRLEDRTLYQVPCARYQAPGGE